MGLASFTASGTVLAKGDAFVGGQRFVRLDLGNGLEITVPWTTGDDVSVGDPFIAAVTFRPPVEHAALPASTATTW